MSLDILGEVINAVEFVNSILIKFDNKNIF